MFYVMYQETRFLNQDACFLNQEGRRQHVTNMKYENRTKHPLHPKILLSLVPCIINHWLTSRNEMRDHAKYIKQN